MKKYILISFVLLIFLSCSNVEDTTYTILTVNSMNGQIFPKEKNGYKSGGFSLLSSKIKEIKNDQINGNVFLIGNSNFIYGKVEAYFTSGKAVIDLMNKVGFDALIIGHREFYFGLDVLKSLSEKAKFPFLSANIVKKDSSRFDYIEPYLILPDGKTAIIGVSSSKVIRANLEKDVSEIIFIDPGESVIKYTQILKNKGIRKIITIGDFRCTSETISSNSHSSFFKIIENSDVNTFIGTSSEKNRKDSAYTCNTRNSIKFLSSDKNGKEMLLYRFNNDTNQEFTTIYQIDSKHLIPDPKLAKTLHGLNKLVNETAGEILGNSEDDIEHLDGNIFRKESHLGDFISDIIREYTQTDIMLLNSGKIRNGFKKGPITMMDLYNILPYEGTIVKISMTGKQILKILESSCAIKMSKSFLQVSGIKFKFDMNNGVKNRIVTNSVMIDGKKLELTKIYSVALTKYIFDGGDQYTEFSNMNVELEMIYQKQMREIIKQYIQKNKTVKLHKNSRIMNVNGDNDNSMSISK